MANPFANIQDMPYVSFRTELPLDQLRSTGETLQNRWEVNSANADALQTSLSNVLTSVHEKDREAVEAYNAQVNKTLNDYAARGDYHNLSREISKLSNQYAMRVRPALEERAAIETDIENIRKRTDMTETDKAKWIEDINRRYQGVQYDKDGMPIRKTYSSGAYASTADANAIALDYVQGWRASNLGISDKEVRTSLTEAMKSNPQLIAYKQSLMGYNAGKYEEMVRNGQMTKEEMDFRLAKDSQDFENSVVNPAIEMAVQHTAYTNYIKPDTLRSNDSRSKGANAILSTNVTPTTNVSGPQTKEIINSKKELEVAIKREPDPTKRAALQSELDSVNDTIKSQIEQAFPKAQDKIDRLYNRYVRQVSNPISQEEFENSVMSQLIEDPEHRTKLTDLDETSDYNNPAIRAAIRTLRKEFRNSAAIQREGTVFYGTEGSLDMRTFTGEYTKHINENFSENVANYVVDTGGGDVQLNKYLSEHKRDSSKDKLYPSSIYKNGKFYQILEITTGSKKGDEEKESILIAPKDQAGYMSELTKIAREYISDETNESNRQQGIRAAAGLEFGAIVEASGFGRRSSGTIMELADDSDGNPVTLIYKEDADEKNVYSLYIKDSSGNLTLYTDQQGDPVRASNVNDLQTKLFLNSPQVWANYLQ